MKILIGKLGAETNDFATEICNMKRYAPLGICQGDRLIPTYRGTADYLGGMIQAGEEEGAEMFPSIGILCAVPTLEKECLEEAVEMLLSYIKPLKDELDGICLGMHGAGAARGIPDMEAYTLKRVREVVGPDMPIMSSLDLHGNISEEMVSLSDGLFGVKNYPHIDEYDAGYLAMKTLIRTIRGEVKPRLAVRRLPLLVMPAIGCTFKSPMMDIRDHVAAYAKENGLIDATFFHGFSYTNVPYAGSSLVVVSEKDAQKHADTLAKWVWERRAALVPECLTCAEALDRAEAELAKPGDGYVVINETSDNPGGGTPGDGTHLLREFLKRNEPGMLFGSIVDPEFAFQAHAAGVGGTVSGLLGGKSDNLHGEPIEIKDAVVLALSNGEATYVSPMHRGLRMHLGKTARVRVGNVEIVVNEVKGIQGMDDRPYLVTGADINEYRIVGLKSSIHFRAWFDSHAKAIVTADPPGIHTSNITQLPFTDITRPAYPLDPDTKFEV